MNKKYWMYRILFAIFITLPIFCAITYGIVIKIEMNPYNSIIIGGTLVLLMEFAAYVERKLIGVK